MRRKKIFTLVVIFVAVGFVLLRPGGGLRRWYGLKVIKSDLSAIDKHISRLESTLDEKSPSAGALQDQINSLQNNVNGFVNRTINFVNRYPGRYPPEVLKNFINDFFRFDEIFIVRIIPRFGGVLDTDGIQSFLSDKLVSFSEVVNIGDLNEYFQDLLQRNDYIFQEFRTAEIIAGIESRIPNSGAAKPLTKLKKDFLLFFAGRLQGAATSTMNLVEKYITGAAGDPVRRLALFDEVREDVLDSNVKTHLNIIRQEFLRKVGEKIDRSIAKRALTEAEEVIQNLKNEIGNREGNVGRAVEQSLSRAKFHLKQAQLFNKKNNYNSAFGQATAATVAVRSVLLPLTIDIGEYQGDIEIIKKQFDYLTVLIGKNNISDGAISKLMTETEKEILHVSRLLETDTESSRTFTALNNLKISIGLIKQRVQEAMTAD